MSRILRERYLIVAVGLCVLVGFGFGAWGEEEHGRSGSEALVDIGKAWFKPILTVNEDPICSRFLDGVRAKYVSEDSDYSMIEIFKYRHNEFKTGHFKNLNFHFLPNDQNSFSVLTARGEKLFGYNSNAGGCGGACERRSYYLSESPFDQTVWKNLPTSSVVSTPLSETWSIVQDDEGEFFFEGQVERNLQLYRLVSPKNWKLSCEIPLEPKMPPQAPESELQTAFHTIQELIDKAEKLTPQSGNCGTMSLADLKRHAMRTALYKTLYRPWNMAPFVFGRSDMGNSNDFSLTEKRLYQWSLGGLGEHHDYQEYQTSLAKAVRELTDFYQKQFGWTATRSAYVANKAVRDAIRQGFLFDPPVASPAEEQLRAALLGHRPLAEIKAIIMDGNLKDFSKTENILNVAISYPDAIDYLLKKGADPEAANEFGKTPLMYAAQYNQVESAKLLLEAGANPNAATIIPDDDCNYRLATSQMTALHYAVRYGSLPLVKLLIGSGASIFVYSNNRINDKMRTGYPVNWLRSFTSPEAGTRRNRYFSASDVTEAIAILQVHDDNERQRIASSEVLYAKKEFAQGKFESAYRALQSAIAAVPDDQQAVSDFPLVALKAGHIGPAIKAAEKAIATLKEPSLAASAWFHLGLICEREEARWVPEGQGLRRRFIYDKSYCDYNIIDPFLRSLRLEPTRERIDKIKSFFDASDPHVCQRARMFLFYGGKNRAVPNKRIYLLHRAEEKIDPANITWTIKSSNDQSLKVIHPALEEDIDLENDVLSLFSGDDMPWDPTIDGVKCVFRE
ncbi:MAG: ankyrin repeat domain-containing protein [Magnetococcales bacterium]|nr:ankyrin repeat domain-containing protein [Magnetococcales bacterium]